MKTDGAGVLDQITYRRGNRWGVCNASSFFPGIRVDIYGDLSKEPKARATIAARRLKRNELVVSGPVRSKVTRGDFIVLRSEW